jgi:hypothetical protein
VVDITYYVGEVNNLPVEIPDPETDTESPPITDSEPVATDEGTDG